MHAHPDWVVLNRGIDGQRTDQILARFERDVVEEGPDYVIILGGVNDIFQGVALDNVKGNLRIVYEKAISAGIRAIAASVLPYNTTTDTEADAIRDVNVWIENTAQALGILFCDTNKAVADPKDRKRLLSSPDGYHPDVLGYRSMGEILGKTITTDLMRREPVRTRG